VSGQWLAWTAGTRCDAEDTARAVSEQHDIPRDQLRIWPAFDGNGWEVWTR
jgi:hypothetical protein